MSVKLGRRGGAGLMLALWAAIIAACTGSNPQSPSASGDALSSASRTAGSSGGDTASESGWLSLFNGRTLDGWVQRGGRAAYRVEDGVIVGATRPDQPNSFLCTRELFTNFELDLEFKVDPELNSGIQIRSESRAEDGLERVFGYQVEIDPSERAWTGGLYDEGRRGWLVDLTRNEDARKAFRRNEWNHFRIEARGDLIRTWINGVPAVELRDAMTHTGFIALQVHGVGPRKDELTVRWRGLRLRELAEGLPTSGANSQITPGSRLGSEVGDVRSRDSEAVEQVKMR